MQPTSETSQKLKNMGCPWKNINQREGIKTLEKEETVEQTASNNSNSQGIGQKQKEQKDTQQPQNQIRNTINKDKTWLQDNQQLICNKVHQNTILIQNLRQAERVFMEAQKNLLKISKSQISDFNSYHYKTPPSGVDIVLKAIMILLNKEVSWEIANRERRDPKFLQRLISVDKRNISKDTLKRLGKLTQDPKMELLRIQAISEVAGYLWRWVLAIKCYLKAIEALNNDISE